MKKVFLLISLFSILGAQAQTKSPIDSLDFSKDISLDEVVVTATKVNKGTPVAYSEFK